MPISPAISTMIGSTIPMRLIHDKGAWKKLPLWTVSACRAAKTRRRESFFLRASACLRAVASRSVADAGARIACVDVQEDNAHRCADAVKKRGGEAIGVVCDVTDEAQVWAAVAHARRLR